MPTQMEDGWEPRERNEEGPRGTYGCACVSRDARECAVMRYGHGSDIDRDGFRCECLCHEWEDDDV
jgi:hypothetical protein